MCGGSPSSLSNTKAVRICRVVAPWIRVLKPAPLASCQVLDMSVLTTMPALRHLDVSHNLLCRMEPMDGRDLPPRLESLNMSHNRISRIGGIGQCFLLRVVDLRHNRIKVPGTVIPWQQ